MGEFVSTLPAWIDPRTMPTCDCWAALGANALCPQCVAAVRAYEAIHAAHTAALQSEKARADAAETALREERAIGQQAVDDAKDGAR